LRKKRGTKGAGEGGRQNNFSEEGVPKKKANYQNSCLKGEGQRRRKERTRQLKSRTPPPAGHLSSPDKRALVDDRKEFKLKSRVGRKL